jgi:Kef-type K+ transport system membrane component KefB
MILLLLLLAIGGLMQAGAQYAGFATSATVQLAFGYLLLVAFLTGRIANKVGLPKLTGYIIAGIISGPSVLMLVTEDMTKSLTIVNGTATAIIALEAGAELQLSSVRKKLRTIRAVALCAVIGSMFVLAAAIYLLRPWLPFLSTLEPAQALAVAFVIGVALSASSPAVVMALLAEMRAAGPLSETLLATVVVSDLLVVVCFSVVSAIASSVIGGAVDLFSTARDVSWELFGSIAFGTVAGMLLGLFLRFVKEGGPLFALTVCAVVAEAGPRVHLDPLIVMLAAGVWVRNFSRAQIATLLNGFERAQLPVFLVFFALAGAKLHVHTLVVSAIPVFVLAASRGAMRFVGTSVAMRISDPPPLVRKHLWVGLMPQAGLSLALALVVEKTYATSFGPDAAVIMFGVVGLNELLSPVLLRQALIKSGEAGQKPAIEIPSESGGH